MRPIISAVLALLIALCSCACHRAVSMESLTEYQNGDFSAKARISLDGDEYLATVQKSGDHLLLRVSEPDELAPFVFILEEDGVKISVGDTCIPIKSRELFKLSEVYSLFTLPVSDTWSITLAHPGGVEVYLCESERAFLYVDKSSLLPLRIVGARAEIDVISFTRE